MPDFVTASYLVEVMGLGRDGILKSMKVTKYDALKHWHRFAKSIGLLGVILFVWNSSEKQFLTLTFVDIIKEVGFSKKKYGIQAFENDGNEYYPLHWARLKAAAAYVGDYDE